MEWIESELGALIHFDITVFRPDYLWRTHWDNVPHPDEFNPVELDTDQWMREIKAMGAKYAVLVAKHCSGFSLWPTSVHDFSVKGSKWRNGQGDIVRDFIESCKKYDIKPGLYYSVTANGYMKVDNPGLVNNRNQADQEAYNKMVETQVTELWTQYGDLFEIWFDGGVLPVSEGGANIIPILKKNQPNAVLFQGPSEMDSLVRWVGNERGVAPYPCWSTADAGTSSAGVVEIENMQGNPDGALWCPAESDFPIRDGGFGGGWFWKKGDDKKLRTHKDLVNRYFETVGRNSNMLLGIVIDDRGLIPDIDVKLMNDFGKTISELFKNPLGVTSGSGQIHKIDFDKEVKINCIEIKEDIKQGERVRNFTVEGFSKGKWIKLDSGSCVGHRYLKRFKTKKITSLRLTIKESAGSPEITRFAGYDI